MALTTETDLADVLGIPVEKVARLRRSRNWPHVRLGRFDVRYTDAQVAEVLRIQTVTPASKAAPVSGQTKRSAARAS